MSSTTTFYRRGTKKTAAEGGKDNEDNTRDHKKSLRRPISETEDIEGDTHNHTHGTQINEAMEVLKTIQKMRKTSRGVNAKTAFEEEDGDELEDVEEDTAYGLMDRQFTTKTDPSVTKDRHLEEFLKEKLNKKSNEQENEIPIIDRENELYKVPDKLKIKDTTVEHADKMNWVTGLVEVPIPIKLKIKNIEATEAAKRKLLKLGESEEKTIKERKTIEHIVRKAYGSRFQNPEPERFQHKDRNDEAAVERYRKNFTRSQAK